MARYILKPVFWNTKGYLAPSGVAATSGYPKEKGYGHEEWNNSERLRFSQNGVDQRAFHTEPVPTSPTHDLDGTLFIILYASFGGVQRLVGIAGAATPLAQRHAEREQLARRLMLHDLWKDAWAIERVQSCYGGDQAEFMRDWNRDFTSIPNWICPADMYFWPDQYPELHAEQITRKSKLLTMFSKHTELSAGQARKVLDMVPSVARNAVWNRLVACIESVGDDIQADIAAISAAQSMTETTRRTLIDARLGTGKFRDQLQDRWDDACAVTGLKTRALLRASHIKPWRTSTNKERLDPHNGLLLSANLDALFDTGVISFSTAGQMLISNEVPKAERQKLGIPRSLMKPLQMGEIEYLKVHEKTIFRSGLVN